MKSIRNAAKTRMNYVNGRILAIAFTTCLVSSPFTLTSAFSGIHSIVQKSTYQPSLSQYTKNALIQKNNLPTRTLSRISCSMTLNEAEEKRRTSIIIDKTENDLNIEEKNVKTLLNGANVNITKEKLTEEIFDEEHHEKLITEKDEVVKEELEAAVKEVKEIFKEVTQSTGKLTETIIEKGPGILTKTFRTLVSKEMRMDISKRKKHYVSDWTDALKNKRQVIPAILFLFFACLAPAVSFGTISSEITNGSIGVVEFLLSSGLSGMVYAVLSGQPMAFVAPTGLTLAFISGLFRFCTSYSLPFFPVYSWVGIWTSLFMVLLGFAGSSKLIKYCTRFTDEVFNALLSLNFLYEAISSLRRNFSLADPSNLTMPFVSLAMALSTFWSTMKVIAFDKTRYLNKSLRKTVKDFGPVAIIVVMSILNTLPWLKKWNVPTLMVPDALQLAGGREFLVPIFSIPTKIRLLCALPAVLLTSLFFMDQNISTRLVNNPENQLTKGAAYNMDMVALGAVTGGLSLVGLPWMCGATVQSMNHVRAMTKYHFDVETQQLEIESVTETRASGFIIHTMIASSVFLLPLLRFLPIPVVSGVFLFLGRKLMTGNSFLARVRDVFAERSRLPDGHCIQKIGKKKVASFTLLQIGCLLALWGFKSNSATAIFFPSVIGMLMLIRSYVLPHFLSEEELEALGDATPS